MSIRIRLAGLLSRIVLITTGAFAPVVFAKQGAIEFENGIDFTPTVALSYWQNSNVIHTETNPIDSNLFRVNVSAVAELQSGRSDFVIFYRGELGQYESSPEDDFENHRLQFKFDTAASKHSEFKTLVFYDELVSDRGDGLTEGLGDTLDGPVEYTDYGAQFMWRYFLVYERYWFDAQALYFNRAYHNGSPYTDGRDRVEMGFRATFFRAVSTGSTWFVQARYNQLDYDDEDPDFPVGFIVTSRDAVDINLLAGIRWQRNVLTYGSIGVGYQNKTYDSPERQGFKGLTWELEAFYSPIERVEIQLNSTRAAVEPPLVGDYVKQVTHALVASYKFRERIEFFADFEYFDEQFIGFDRKEDTSLYGVGIEYEWRSNIKFRLRAQREDKHSNLEGFTYDQNIIGLQVELGLK